VSAKNTPLAGDDQRARFDLAFGVGETLVEFAFLFTDLPALMWRSFPDWLMTDDRGKIIPMGQKPHVVPGARRAMERFLTTMPDGKIHFNLLHVTPSRPTTFGALSFIRQTPDLRVRTWYYENTKRLDDEQVKTILKTLGLS
jgi:hypothetical protein